MERIKRLCFFSEITVTSLHEIKALTLTAAHEGTFLLYNVNLDRFKKTVASESSFSLSTSELKANSPSR